LSVSISGKTFDCIQNALKGIQLPDARLSTDEAHKYRKIAKDNAQYLAINHSKDEYFRGDVSMNVDGC
jgi:hypothetical protein